MLNNAISVILLLSDFKKIGNKNQQTLPMKNKQNSAIQRDPKYLNRELKMFKNLAQHFCCSAEKVLDSFEQFSEKQKSEILQELERTSQNVCAISEYVSNLSGVSVNPNKFIYAQEGERVTVIVVKDSTPHKHRD